MLSRRYRKRIFLLLLLGAAAFAGVRWTSIQPTNHRDWVVEHLLLPAATIANDSVYIADIRNFDYKDADRFTPGYYDGAFDLEKLESAWLVLMPFSDWSRGPVHGLVSFGFSDSQFVAISVEARREEGETYSPLQGAIKQYELVYVIGSERDLIGQRAAFTGTPVYMYPIRAPRKRIRSVFVSMVLRANRLREQPEFYNTAINNSTFNVVRHVNEVAPGKVPAGLKTFLPGYTESVAYQLGLIEAGSDLERARDRFRVNERAQSHYDDPLFSWRIREAEEIGPSSRAPSPASEAASQ